MRKEILVSNLIEKLKIHTGTKSDKDIATYLGITPSALNNFKRRNSLGAFIEKILDNEHAQNNSISFDYLFDISAANTQFDKKIFMAKELSISLGYEKEFENLIDEYITNLKSLSPLIQILQTIKGKDLIYRLFEMCSGKGERMLLVLYYFLDYLKHQKINFQNVKKDFLTALQDFRIPNNAKTKHFFAFGDADKKNLLHWAEAELDEVACFEIINAKDTLLQVIIKNELTTLNQLVIS